MTRNEAGLLADWLRYHGDLFGFANLYVLDGSDDPEVLQIYDQFLPQGLNVQFSSTGLEGLEAELNLLIRENKGNSRFLIKLDTDEFLGWTEPVLPTRSTTFRRLFARLRLLASHRAPWIERWLNVAFDWSLNRRVIRIDGFDEFFDSLPVTGQRYKASVATWSIPGEQCPERVCCEATTFSPRFFTQFKTFFHSDSFVSVDLGSHTGVATRQDGVIETGLTIIHYHSTSRSETIRRARQVLVSHEYIAADDTVLQERHKLVALRARGDIPSFHKIDLYLRYLASLDDGEPLPLELLNSDNPYFRTTGRSRQMTVVRDHLRKIESGACLGRASG